MVEDQAGLAGDNTPPNTDPRVQELEQKLAQWEKRYSDSTREAQRVTQLNQQLQSQLYETHRQDVPQRNSAGQRLADVGIPVDALEELVTERARSLVQEQFQPIMRGMQARTELVGRYKDFAKFESDIGELLNEDQAFQQTYNRVYQADPAAALELAYHRLGDTKRKTHKGERFNSEEEMAGAQIPSQRSGDARRSPNGNDAVYSQAADNYRKSPNRRTAEALFKARMKSVISDDHLGQ